MSSIIIYIVRGCLSHDLAMFRLQMSKRMNVLSKDEVEKTGEGVPLYKQYGRPFVLHVPSSILLD